MRWSLSLGISLAVLALVPAPRAHPQDLGLEADLGLVVKMPLAVADAFDAGVPADELGVLTRSLIEGAVPPADFIEVVTLAPVVYVPRVGLAPAAPVRLKGAAAVRPRRAPGPGIGVYVQRQLARGLRGPELATAIHRELRRRGVPAGPPGLRVGVRGGDRVALDLHGLRDLQTRRDGWLRDRDEGRLEIGRKARGRRHVPPGHLAKRGKGKGPGVAPGHARARGRGHAKGHGKGHGPPPHARGGHREGPGHGNGNGQGQGGGR